jgi:uncharacterized protein (DUF2132 family)
MILNRLVEHYGWDMMGKTINIRCFNNDPSIKSSLKFLRKTPWARSKVEALYLRFKKETFKRAGREKLDRGISGKVALK